MEPKDFTGDRNGRLARTPQNYWAFIPSPLPPQLPIDWTLADHLSRADRALGELGGLARNLPNPHLLISPFLRREAVLSSRIEGTQASLSDLFFFEAADSARFMPDRQTPHDVREVANYVKALEYALKRLDELPLSLRLIRELHEILLSGVRGQHWTPGEFRSSQNWIGPPGSTLMEAVYVPPPPQEMVEALGEFEKYLHAPSGLPPLIRIALVHYQFEAIHPFLDGNGRIGRLLISLLLCSEGLVPQPLLYISAFFERQRADYYRHLLHVSLAGQWTAWLIFFLEGVAQQSRDAIWRTAQLLSMWQSYRSRLQEARSSALLLQLVDRLFQYPVLSVPGTTKALEITHRSATKLIERLVAARILTEVTGRERNRLYVAQDIIKAMEAEVPKEDEPLAARRSDEGDVQ